MTTPAPGGRWRSTAGRRTALTSLPAGLTAAEIIASLSYGPGGGWSILPLAAALAVTGTVLALRLPRNPIGWLLSAWSVICGYAAWIGAWAAHAVAAHEIGGLLPWAADFVTVIWHPGFWLFVMICLVFPNGRFMSVRWKRLAMVITGWYVALAIAAALAPTEVALYVPHVPPPYVSPVQGPADAAFGFLLGTQLLWLPVGAVALVVRWRRSHGNDRRQVTAFVFPTAFALVAFVVVLAFTGSGSAGPYVFPILPLAIGIAVTRYRLYELDRFVSRTVAYAILTAVVVVVYVGAVQLVTLALPHAGSFAVAAATLAAAAVFTPLRRRVQRFVDRRFNRARYDTERVIEGFRSQVRREHALLHVEGELVAAVRQTLHPATCSVWVLGSTSTASVPDQDRTGEEPAAASRAGVVFA